MHSRIFQLSMESINETEYIEEFDYYDHWFTKEIADYVVSQNIYKRDGDIKWLKDCVKGITIDKDENGEFLVVTDRKAYFKSKFKDFKEAVDKVSKYTIDDFVNGSSYEIWRVRDSYEDKFGFYVDADGELMTLDSFVRYCAVNEKYYIGGTIDYHY